MVRSRLILLLCLAGCGSVETVGDGGEIPASSTGELTVIVWSAHLQREVPAHGMVSPIDDPGRVESFDTRAAPGAGQTLTLQPGQYQISIRYRYLATGVQNVEGEEVVYLEPGAKRTLRVVVTDSKEDIGKRTGRLQNTSPAVSTPPLPLESKPG